ncbi:hypothetical protein FSP39_023365 [Pinctada imbricata]|uniref:Heat shock 70 kDa protein 12A n=1 Tax=Pinctada imbricata TaxID=66713 RepID=A0AA88YRA2_PINIB|nr:hypothetical protein FSP39_023365 [Pinctada imbricata]
MASSEDGKLLVAAIDFGTAYTGYAFSMRTDFKTNPLKIEINSWSGEGIEMLSYKTPSSILLKSDKTFHSFGYTAEEKYAELAGNDQHSDWYYITKFKMKLLYKEKIDRNCEIETIDGKKISGMDVISMALKFVTGHLMSSLEKNGLGVRLEDIFWVITVPAIWSDAAKQFTREAAEKIGIKDDSLIFAYEPESAAIYCRYVPLSGAEIASGTAAFTKGKTLMIVDVGGGTADISVLEIEDKDSLKIVERATGGPWGGVTVDQEFEHFLNCFWGEAVMEEYKKEYFSDYLLLIRSFENKKRGIDLESQENVPLSFRLTRNFRKIYQDKTGKKFKDCAEDNQFNKHVVMDGYTMNVNSDYAYDTIFKLVVDSIVEASKNILEKHSGGKKVSAIILVGGMSQLQPFVNEMKKQCKVPVYVPTDAGIAVLKGAVIFGHNKNVIKSRVCKYTYGVRTMRKFDSSYDERKKVHQEGDDWAKDCFKVFYEANSPIRLGDKREHILYDTFKDSSRTGRRTKPIKLDLFISTEPQPRYVTDESCRSLGQICINPPTGGFPEVWEGKVELEFAGTEIVGRVIDDFDTTTVRFDYMV